MPDLTRKYRSTRAGTSPRPRHPHRRPSPSPHDRLEDLMLRSLGDSRIPAHIVDCVVHSSGELARGEHPAVLLRDLASTILAHDGWLPGDLHAHAWEARLAFTCVPLPFDPPIRRVRLWLMR